MRGLLLFLCVVFAIPFCAEGQSFYAIRRERSLLISAGSGTSTYLGEMVDPGRLGQTRYNITFGAEYFLTRRISVKSDLTYFSLAGDDAKASESLKGRNLSFTSSNIELVGLGTYHLFPKGKRYYQRPTLNFYVFGGIGGLYFNPKSVRQNGEKVALQPLQTEGVAYSKFQLVIPGGLGAKFKFGPLINVVIEGGYRKTFTDYLDDVSSNTYPDPATLSSPLAIEMSDRRGEVDATPPPFSTGRRGNPANDDGYFLMNVKLQYYLPTSFGGNSSMKFNKKKRKAFYRYNKRGGLKRR